MQMNFDNLYQLQGQLGQGAYSIVREGFHKYNRKISCAVKCIDRTKLSEVDEKDIMNEVCILKNLRHKNIIQLYDGFTESNVHYLVMERLRGGELFDRIISKTRYSEAEARATFRNILEAVQYCHEKQIAHRDLKPENLLLVSENDNTTIKIADFGYAKRVLRPNSLVTACGTRSYVAPEIVNGIPYDQAVDMWSLGVILYILLSGLQPFHDTGDDGLFDQICNGEFYFDDECWDHVSMEAKLMICSLLVVNPAARLNASQALAHPWFQIGHGIPTHKENLYLCHMNTPVFQTCVSNSAA